MEASTVEDGEGTQRCERKSSHRPRPASRPGRNLFLPHAHLQSIPQLPFKCTHCSLPPLTPPGPWVTCSGPSKPQPSIPCSSRAMATSVPQPQDGWAAADGARGGRVPEPPREGESYGPQRAVGTFTQERAKQNIMWVCVTISCNHLQRHNNTSENAD